MRFDGMGSTTGDFNGYEERSQVICCCPNQSFINYHSKKKKKYRN